MWYEDGRYNLVLTGSDSWSPQCCCDVQKWWVKPSSSTAAMLLWHSTFYDVTMMLLLSQRSQSFVLREKKYFPVDLIDSAFRMFYVRPFQNIRCIEIYTFTVYLETGIPWVLEFHACLLFLVYVVYFSLKIYYTFHSTISFNLVNKISWTSTSRPRRRSSPSWICRTLKCGKRLNTARARTRNCRSSWRRTKKRWALQPPLTHRSFTDVYQDFTEKSLLVVN